MKPLAPRSCDCFSLPEGKGSYRRLRQPRVEPALLRCPLPRPGVTRMQPLCVVLGCGSSSVPHPETRQWLVKPRVRSPKPCGQGGASLAHPGAPKLQLQNQAAAGPHPGPGPVRPRPPPRRLLAPFLGHSGCTARTRSLPPTPCGASESGCELPAAELARLTRGIRATSPRRARSSRVASHPGSGPPPTPDRPRLHPTPPYPGRPAPHVPGDSPL